MEPLHRRLEALETREIRSGLEKILPADRIDPTSYLADERYFKKGRDELSYAVEAYLARKGTKIEKGFQNKLYRSFTPKRGHSKRGSTYPFLDMLYGRVLADKLPNEIFEQLYDFEAIYFLAGLWSANSAKHWGNRFTDKKIHAWNVKKTIAWTIEQGVNRLKRYEVQLGKQLPRKKAILESCEKAEDTQRDLF